MKPLFPLILTILLLTSITLAQEPTDLYRYNSLIIDLTISSVIELHPKDENSYIKEISTELSLFPRETPNQNILTLTTNPQATPTDDAYTFMWEYPEETALPFKLSAQIESTATPVTIRNKIPFPFIMEDPSLQVYLQETEMVDFSNAGIKAIANELATGEDDALAVAVKMADWTRLSISYNLTTLTAEATQSASWTLENKYGVCDELTNLYIALLRSVGIPARFVTGISYTSSDLFANPWNPHGWTEVYFPEYGWVPFDVTYGQYSFSDPTHVKLADGVDSLQTSISYQWQGKDVAVTSTNIDFQTEIIEYGDVTTEPIVMSTEMYKEDVGFGSYNLMITTIENKVNYYIPLHIILAIPEELTTTTSTQATIVLEPNGKATHYWLIHVNENLDPQYEYTFSPEIYTIANQSVETVFTANVQGTIVDQETLQAIIDKKKEEETKAYSKDIMLECEMNKIYFYPQEPERITCATKNIGNTPQEIDLCFDQECATLQLGILEEKTTTFLIKTKHPGDYIGIIEAKNEDLTKIAELEYAVLDTPTLRTTMEIEEEVPYGEDGVLTLVADVTSFQDPQNVLFNIKYGNKEEWYKIEELSKETAIEHVINTKDLRKTTSPISVRIIYEDKEGHQFEEETATTITVTNANFLHKIRMWFLNIIGF
jgi:transglutaminase-like putative cysteine protease